MKAEMSEDGVITILPESSVEAYALRRWMNEADIEVRDVGSDRILHPHCSKLAINAAWPQESDK